MQFYPESTGLHSDYGIDARIEVVPAPEDFRSNDIFLELAILILDRFVYDEAKERSEVIRSVQCAAVQNPLQLREFFFSGDVHGNERRYMKACNADLTLCNTMNQKEVTVLYAL